VRGREPGEPALGRAAASLTGFPDRLVVNVTGREKLGAQHELCAGRDGFYHQRLGAREIRGDLAVVALDLDGGDADLGHAAPHARRIASAMPPPSPVGRSS